jgi:integrase
LVRFETEHYKSLKPKSSAQYSQLIRSYIRPALGDKKLSQVAPDDVEKLHGHLYKTPYAANRLLATLSVFFAWAESKRLIPRGSNPVTGVKKYREEKRQAYLNPEQLRAIFEAARDLLAEGLISQTEQAAILVLLLTGARQLEILSLKWADIDFEAGTAALSDSKTGARLLPLPAPVIEIIQKLARGGSFVFANPADRSGHYTDLRRSWGLILERAGAGHWRIHDLRHTFASIAVNSGLSLPLIGAVLGHRARRLQLPAWHQA